MTFHPVRLSLIAAAAAALAACSSTPIPPTPVAAPPVAAKPAPAPVAAAQPKPAQPQPAPASQVATVTLPAYLDPSNPVSSQRSVYFAFDDTALTNADQPVIERHGKYLAANPKLAIRVEGNTDERGSAEYNLALGQKRAESVVKALKLYGVRDTQMEAISWGEEKPRARGHDESAWTQNRRADLQYPAR